MPRFRPKNLYVVLISLVIHNKNRLCSKTCGLTLLLFLRKCLNIVYFYILVKFRRGSGEFRRGSGEFRRGSGGFRWVLVGSGEVPVSSGGVPVSSGGVSDVFWRCSDNTEKLYCNTILNTFQKSYCNTILNTFFPEYWQYNTQYFYQYFFTQFSSTILMKCQDYPPIRF